MVVKSLLSINIITVFVFVKLGDIPSSPSLAAVALKRGDGRAGQVHPPYRDD